MAAVTLAIRVDEETKREFAEFCAEVGISQGGAINMFIKATLRSRQLPFPITSEPAATVDR